MTCRDVRRLASHYVDGELDERRSTALRGHLRLCPPCAALTADHARLRDAAGELEAIEPPDSMWQAIQARVGAAEAQVARRGRLREAVGGLASELRRHALVAAVGLAGAIWLLLSLRGREPLAALHAPAAPAVARAERRPILTFEEGRVREIAAAERRYGEAIADLRAEVDAQRSELSPAAATRFDQAWAKLAADERRAREALPVDVVDVASRDQLHAVYRAEIDLLTRAATGPELAELP